VTDRPDQHGYWDLTILPEHIRAKVSYGRVGVKSTWRDGSVRESPPIPQIFFGNLTEDELEEVKALGFTFDFGKVVSGFQANRLIKTGDKPPVEEIQNRVRPKISWANFKSVMAALLTGKRISRERQMARLEVCHGCDKFQWDGENARCGVCGCKLDGDKALVKLTLYEETEAYGCKHPEGSRWLAAGV
jgi:hypothetical protein